MSELIEFARHEFKLGKRGKDGKSLRETLEVVERMTGRTQPESVNPAEFPDVLYDLWLHFMNLNAERSQGMGGHEPLGSMQIQAYSTLRRVRFEEWELNAFRELDAVAMASYAQDGD